MKNIHKICKQVLAITEAELKDAEREAKEQVDCVHPLKLAMAARVNSAGRHNIRVIAAIRELRKEIATP